jgi:hypothetical protein
MPDIERIYHPDDIILLCVKKMSEQDRTMLFELLNKYVVGYKVENNLIGNENIPKKLLKKTL